MTLLLGPPGSGKTSLLLALAGKLDKELKVQLFFSHSIFWWMWCSLFHLENENEYDLF